MLVLVSHTTEVMLLAAKWKGEAVQKEKLQENRTFSNHVQKNPTHILYIYSTQVYNIDN